MHATDPVNRIMTEPVLTIGPDDSVKDMLQLFVAYPVHHLPVVEDGQVVGMLSSADLLKLEFFLPPPGRSREALLSDRFQVRKVMRTPVVSITEHESVQRAAELMAHSGFHSLPVVSGNGGLIGIVTTTDLMHSCLQSSAGSRLTDENTHAAAIDAHFATSLAKAREALDRNDDPHGIAAALVQLQQRMGAMEVVVQAAKRYVNAGQDERLHTALSKAIEQADRFNQRAGRPSMLGLDAGE